jgi:hypothetical protein
VSSKFVDVNLTNAVIDRVVFDKADLSGAKLHNAVVTGSTFEVRARRGGGEERSEGRAGGRRRRRRRRRAGSGRRRLAALARPPFSRPRFPTRTASAHLVQARSHGPLQPTATTRQHYTTKNKNQNQNPPQNQPKQGATLTGTDWEDALIGSEDVKRLCLNPTLTGESRFQVGCRGG